MKIQSNEIVIYKNKKGEVELQADIKKDTIWATQEQIAQLFDGSKQTISRHLLRIFGDGELTQDSVVKESLTTGGDGKKYRVKSYNLDAIIAVGYRINSKKATQFRIWATSVLREFLLRGHRLDKNIRGQSPEAVIGLREAVEFMRSKKHPGKLKGRMTLRLTRNVVHE